MEYLTNTEELMMKCIWNYGKEMPFLRMGEELKDKFHKEYKRTSIRTYLFRLEDKGYIKVEKRGRKAYINALIDETTYKTEKAASMLDEWFDGSAKELFSALNQKIPKEDQESLKDMLDEMDFKLYSDQWIYIYRFWNSLRNDRIFDMEISWTMV